MAHTSTTHTTHTSTTEPIIQISVINASTVLTDSEIPPVVKALQDQVTKHFNPVWGVDAQLSFVPSGSKPPAKTWWLTLLDDSDQAGALGYHDLTSEGLPLSKVFAASDLKYGSSWTVTASHELLEMLADPNINLTVFVQNSNTKGTLYSYEVCDACEDDSLAYKIGDVEVSDFVYPSWFEDFRKKNSTQFDYGKHISEPFQLLKGGYIGIFDVTGGSGWQQKTAQELTDMMHRGNVGSRRERRRTPREQWVESLPHEEVLRRASRYQERLQKLARRAAA